MANDRSLGRLVDSRDIAALDHGDAVATENLALEMVDRDRIGEDDEVDIHGLTRLGSRAHLEPEAYGRSTLTRAHRGNHVIRGTAG